MGQIISRNESVFFEFSTNLSLYHPAQFIQVVQMGLDDLPDYIPDKWGFLEPVERFDPNALEKLIPNNSDKMRKIVWEKTRRNRFPAYGFWSVRNAMYPTSLPHYVHAASRGEVFDLEHEDDIIKFIRHSAEFEVNIGFIDAITSKYKPYGIKNDFIPIGGLMRLSTHVLLHWLPDIPWGCLFGENYVQHFGRARLLSAPVFLAEEIGKTIYLQLTSTFKDLFMNFDTVMRIREDVKHYLGYDSFYHESKKYDRREHPELAGKKFSVPNFTYLP